MRFHIGACCLLALLLGCPDTEARFDFDGDGVEDSADCAPEDPDNFPGNPEDEYGDEIDTNCDGYDGIDVGGDGYPSNVHDSEPFFDCNDANDTIHPGAPDTVGDGWDNNCDGVDGVDVDGDGFAAGDGATQDCDDVDSDTYPGADELADALDNDCDGDVDEGTATADDDDDGYCEGHDLDGDGVEDCVDGADPGDCDDTDPDLTPADIDADGYSPCDGDCDDDDDAINPGAAEVCNLLDDDCDGVLGDGETDEDGDTDPACSDCDDAEASQHTLDLDGDGFNTCDDVDHPGGGDCNDEEAWANPAITDLVGDDYDQNCDGVDGTDGDGDGYASVASGGDDCDDTLEALNHDDLDLDGWTTCAGDCDDGDPDLELDDLDGDGFDTCAGDCDDGDPGLNPGADEVCDGIDNDCDPGTDELVDDDGDGDSECDGDCDDAEPLTFPGAQEQCDNADNDCDGVVDEDVDEDGDGDGVYPCQGDCDDTDPEVFLHAPELCDGLDNDCDGTPGAGELDDDGDGWMVCEGDCDDADIYVNPHAAELCDGLDNDCDGTADDDCVACDWSVPGDFATLAEAIAGAGTADVLCVEPGLYAEQLLVEDDLVLAGLAGSRLTIIDGGQGGSVVEIVQPAGPDTLLTGLGLTGGLAATYGGGVFVDGSSPTLRKLTLTGNHADWGGGVAVYDPSEAVLEDLVFEDNSCDQWGGGLYIRGNATPTDVTVRRAHFVHNDGGGYVGGGGMAVYGSQCQVHVEQLLFDGNTAAGGGAMLVYGAELDGGWVWAQANHSETGSAIFNYSGTVRLENAALVANTGYGALETDSGITELTNVTFVANHSSSVGGAVYHNASDPLVLTNVEVSYNEAPNGGAGLWMVGIGGLQASHCNIWGNVGEDVDGVTYTPGVDGNLSDEPIYLDTSHPNPARWDLHLAATSPLMDAGDAGIVDPDGSVSDIGAYGGPGAESWDVDLDGWYEWWQPGEYDAVNYPAEGWDCDDRDAGVYPGEGC